MGWWTASLIIFTWRKWLEMTIISIYFKLVGFVFFLGGWSEGLGIDDENCQVLMIDNPLWSTKLSKKSPAIQHSTEPWLGETAKRQIDEMMEVYVYTYIQ